MNERNVAFCMKNTKLKNFFCIFTFTFSPNECSFLCICIRLYFSNVCITNDIVDYVGMK